MGESKSVLCAIERKPKRRTLLHSTLKMKIKVLKC